MSRSGYMLFEMLVSVLLIGFLALAAVTSFRRDLPSHAVDRSVWMLTSSLRDFRVQAICENRPVSVAYNPSNGVLRAWIDRDGNTTGSFDEVTTCGLQVRPGLLVSATPTSGVFTVQGRCVSGASPWTFEIAAEDCTQRVFVLPTGRTLREDS